MRARQAGQASLEFLAGIPVLILAGLIVLQLAAVAHALHLADGAAEAGALATAAGLDARPAALGALPRWAADGARVKASASRIEIFVRPLAPVPAIARALEVSSTAWVHAGDG